MYELAYYCCLVTALHKIKALNVSLRQNTFNDCNHSGANFLGFTVLWPFTHNFQDIFSIICLRPDLYWSWGTTIIWLPTNLFKNRFPLQPISMVCMKKKRSNESFNKFANFLTILPSMCSKIGAFFLWNEQH